MATRTFKSVNLVPKWYMGESLYEVSGVSMKHLNLLQAPDAQSAFQMLEVESRSLPDMGEAKARNGKWYYADLGLEVTPLNVKEVTDEMANELRLKSIL